MPTKSRGWSRSRGSGGSKAEVFGSTGGSGTGAGSPLSELESNA
jgi:hypothetical protein